MNYSTPSMGTYGSTWQAVGYSGNGNVAELVGSLAGRTAIVCGSAYGVFEDFETIRQRIEDVIVFAVNDVGMFLPHVDHWASLHPNQFPQWKSVRWIHEKEAQATKYHGFGIGVENCDYDWTGLNPCFAISGYFAAQIAFIMGCSRIILCGCPGTKTRRFFEARPREDFAYGAAETDRGIRQQLIDEMERLPDFANAIRSMSGWTHSYLGGP